jgi:competence protein ComEA
MSNKDPFFVSQSNKRGVLIFLTCAILIVFIPRIAMWFEEPRSFTIKSEKIAALISARSRMAFKQKSSTYFKPKHKVYLRPLKRFDPNLYTQADWQKLGLSPKQATVVLKFCSRGIYSNEQLKRIFVIPEKLYTLIKDSTVYPERPDFMAKFVDKKTENETIEKKRVPLEINSAEAEALDKLPGIGAFFTKNIMNYREKLGGFIRKEQLMEVWKMDEAKYNELANYVSVDPALVNKININQVDVNTLRKHPYFNWNIANSIVKLRAQKQQFNSLEELKESILINQELFEKIKPYLTL